MAQQLEKQFVDITRRAPGYPLWIAAAFAAVCVIAGIGVSIGAASWPAALLFVLTAVAFAAFAYFSRLHSPARDDSARVLHWHTALPEVQRQSLAIEVAEIARTFDVDPAELYSAYIVAEDLALRQIQEEQNAPLLRHVQAGRSSFDALVIKPGEITCVEVSFLVTPVLRQEKIDASLKKTALLRRFLKAEGIASRVRLLLAVVTQLSETDEAHLLTTLGRHRFVDDSDAGRDVWLVDHDDIEVRLLDFETLQRRYLGDV
ncbi:MAG: hypothetical protein ACK4S4_08145 [Pyrinomonadaceae bacterium]